MRFAVTYHVRCDPASVEARADGIAVEQSVEMPLAGIEDPAVLTDIVGQVEAIDRPAATEHLPCGSGWRRQRSARMPASS